MLTISVSESVSLTESVGDLMTGGSFIVMQSQFLM